MNAKEYRELDVKELKEKLDEQVKKQFQLQMLKSTGQLTTTHLITTARKEIARIKTIMHEKATGVANV